MMIITEDYVSFETAKLLKEKGFNAQCRAAYTDYGKLFTTQIQQYITNIVCSKGYLWECVAPTHQMAMKWLREEKKISIEVNTNFDFNDGNKWYYEYGFCIFQLSGTFKKFAECDYDGYKTYEEACEAAIKYCLENLL